MPLDSACSAGELLGETPLPEKLSCKVPGALDEKRALGTELFVLQLEFRHSLSHCPASTAPACSST